MYSVLKVNEAPLKLLRLSACLAVACGAARIGSTSEASDVTLEHLTEASTGGQAGSASFSSAGPLIAGPLDLEARRALSPLLGIAHALCKLTAR